MKNNAWRVLNRILLFWSVLGILIFTIMMRGERVVTISIIPFEIILKNGWEKDIARQYFMNIFLFIPLGMTTPFSLWNGIKIRNARDTIIIGFLLSLLVECMQVVFHRGGFETDDLIMNTLGTGFGSISFIVCSAVSYSQKRREKRKI